MQQDNTPKTFSLREMLSAFADLPRVLRLIWDASPTLMIGMAFIMLLQGLTPLANVIIVRLLIDGALQGIIHSTIQPIVLPVILELVVNVVSRVCSRLRETFQILINNRFSDYVTLLILRKASTLDLSAFENAEFYDRLTRAHQELGSKPIMMVMKTLALGE